MLVIMLETIIALMSAFFRCSEIEVINRCCRRLQMPKCTFHAIAWSDFETRPFRVKAHGRYPQQNTSPILCGSGRTGDLFEIIAEDRKRDPHNREPPHQSTRTNISHHDTHKNLSSAYRPHELAPETRILRPQNASQHSSSRMVATKSPPKVQLTYPNCFYPYKIHLP